MVAVPAVLPLTTPDALTEAIVAADELQLPPVVVLVIVMLAPAQTALAPAIAATTGSGLTVTALVTGVVPQVLVTA